MWDNLADILQKLAAKKPIKSWLLWVARENLRLKNSFIYTKICLSTPKITKTRKLQYFPIIVNMCAYMVIKTGKKEKTVCFSLIYIRIVQFVPRFFPRCPLYSFIISMTILPFLVALMKGFEIERTIRRLYKSTILGMNCCAII